MYIEKIYKLKLKPDEAEALKKCEALLEDILHDFNGDNSLLCGVCFGDISFAADVLSHLNASKEWY